MGVMCLCDMNIKEDVLYGLFAGWNCVRGTEHGFVPYKDWALHFYFSAKARKLGMQYQKREYVDCDFLTFELKVADLFEMAKLEPVICRERGRVVGDVLKFIKERQ